MLGLLAVDDPVLPIPRSVFELIRTGCGVEVRADGMRREPWQTEEEALADLYFSVIRHASEGPEGTAAFHAGLFAFDGGTVLVPGDSACGKSSLVLACCLAGAAYGGDDLVLLDLESLELIPFPVALALSREGLARFGDPAGEALLLEGEVWLEEREVRCFLDPNRFSPGAAAAAPPSLVVFRRPPSTEPARLVPIRPAEGLQRLYRHAGFAWEERKAVFDALARLAERTPLFEGFGDSGDLAPLILQQLAAA